MCRGEVAAESETGCEERCRAKRLDEGKSSRRIWETDLGLGRVNEAFWGGRLCDLMGAASLGKGMSSLHLGGEASLGMQMPGSEGRSGLQRQGWELG